MTVHAAHSPQPDTGFAALTAPPSVRLPTFDARILLAGAQVAQILLDDHVYTLRITKAGKLILTK